MEEFLGFLNTISFDEILTAITDFLAKINLQEILDKIIAFISGLAA